MERRKFLIGLGSFAAGTVAAIGTGGFRSSSTNRRLSVAVAHDAATPMDLSPVEDSPYSMYVSQDGSGGELVFAVADASAGERGVNLHSHMRMNDLFEVTNQGTQQVCVFIPLVGNGAETNAYFYDSKNPTRVLSPDNGEPDAHGNQKYADSLGPYSANIERSAATLDPGESIAVGLDVEALGPGTTCGVKGALQIDVATEQREVSRSRQLSGGTFVTEHQTHAEDGR